MAQFTATVYQNEFLPDGGTDVNAIVTVTCTGAGEAGRGAGGQAGEIIIVDTSGSMGRTKIESAKIAASAAIDQILDGTWFAVVAGTHLAYLAFPPARSETTPRSITSVRRAAYSKGLEIVALPLIASTQFISCSSCATRVSFGFGAP